MIEYICAMCLKPFHCTDEDHEAAKKELKENFGDHVKPEHGRLVCDDCYQRIRPDQNPEAFAAYKAITN